MARSRKLVETKNDLNGKTRRAVVALLDARLLDAIDLYFTEISREIDKYLWFVEAHNQGRE